MGAKLDDDTATLGRARERFGDDPDGVRAEVWERVSALDARAEPERLAELFAAGRPPSTPDGACEGRVLGLFGSLAMTGVDVAVRAGRLLGGIGWTGKTFDVDAGTGYNRLTTTSLIPMSCAMPGYRFVRRGGELTGFRFDHHVGASIRDPDVEVVSLVYEDPAYRNPLVLPRTRDELVELVDGVWLGRALLRTDDRWDIVAYFVLRPRVGRTAK